MRTILIDDEALALRDLERQLAKIGGVEISATYLDPGEAISVLEAVKPDVVFMDIDMPDMNGLEAAERIQQIDASIDIVFVTAYEEYAVRAFEINALDYLLKPIRPERLAKTLERVKSRDRSAPSVVPVQPVTVRCFQQIAIEFAGGDPFAWRTTKAQELFAYLVYRRHQPIRKDALIEILWPHMDMKRAYSLLYTTIYQLRKSFESAGFPFQIKSSGNGYAIYLGDADLDVEQWEYGLHHAPAIDEASLPQHTRLLDMYRGDFLADHDYPWADNERERLRTLWYQHALAVGLYLQDNGKRLEAAAVYLRVQMLFPYSESNYWTLIRLYAEIGDRSSVELHYEQLVTMLQEEYGETPSIAMQEQFEQWLRRAESPQAKP
ncbi:response regulator [Cohnella sp. CFH 77786]|uniref:response regulator n=1 Tax=Cohnella sp. CFH 77786 TaxID=2662265 RepID=UPI001C60EFEA|nr:response regulator [Cohnella sp. CFH 77786]MBW5448776.1 response regulator [Cohnella sp. CFH 77786]